MDGALIRVATNSVPHRVAGAIANTLRQQCRAEVQAIGAGAVNQMIKAVILARGYLAAEQMQPFCVPSFTEVSVNGRTCTAVHLLVMIEKN
jgi:stage V sporulation protein S